MATSADLVVNIVTKLSGDGMDQATKSTSKFKSGLATASKFAGAALLGIGAAAFKAADAAAEDAQSQALLANSMKNAAGASQAQIAATEDWIDAQSRATGVADDELRPALGSLVRATGDVAKSQKALKIAMDISAATGKPLKSVTDAMAKGFGGQTAALSRLVPGISKAAVASGDFNKVLDEVAKKTKGAAAASADTAAGKMKIFSTSLQETEEAAGAALLPALQGLMDILVPLGHWAQDHGTMFTVIAGAVAVMAAAIIALNVALKIYNTITAVTAIVTESAWLAALGPILLVIAAVALVVAAIVLLWKKCDGFRNAVKAVWAVMKAGARAAWAAIQKLGDVAKSVFDWIKSHGRAIGQDLRVVFQAVATVVANVWNRIRDKVSAVLSWMKSAVRGAVSVIKDVWGDIREKAGAVWDAIREKTRAVMDAVKSIVDGVRDKAGAVFTAIGDAWSNLLKKLKLPPGLAATLKAPFDAMKAAINLVKTAVENLISALGRIHVPKIHLPHIPGLNVAAVPSGITPAGLSANPTARGLGASAVPRAVTVGAPVTIYVSGAIDPESTARQIQRILSGHDRRVGVRVAS